MEEHQEKETIIKEPEPVKGAVPTPAEALLSDTEEEKSQSEASKPAFVILTKENMSHETFQDKVQEEEEPMEIAVEPTPLEPDVPEENIEENLLKPMVDISEEVSKEGRSEEEDKYEEQSLEENEKQEELVESQQEDEEEEEEETEILDIFEQGDVPPSVLSEAEDILGATGFSPIADLDSTVDMEMDNTPTSHRSLSEPSSPRGRGRDSQTHRSWSPDLSLRLTQSPFSTEASPREATPSPTREASPPMREAIHSRALTQIQSQAQSQAQSGYNSSGLPTTIIPLTPKIGMGKPAISKRRFSPGRPRVKQVRVLSRVLFSASSQETFQQR